MWVYLGWCFGFVLFVVCVDIVGLGMWAGDWGYLVYCLVLGGWFIFEWGLKSVGSKWVVI